MGLTDIHWAIYKHILNSSLSPKADIQALPMAKGHLRSKRYRRCSHREKGFSVINNVPFSSQSLAV